MLVAKKEETYYSNINIRHRSQEVVQRKRPKKKIKNMAAIKVKILSLATIVLVICLSLLLRYTVIAQYRIDLTNLDKEIASLNKQKRSLEIQLDQIKQSEWIELEAREKLGMDYPQSNQTVFISVSENLFGEDVSQETEAENGNIFLKSFKGFFNKISELF